MCVEGGISEADGAALKRLLSGVPRLPPDAESRAGVFVTMGAACSPLHLAYAASSRAQYKYGKAAARRRRRAKRVLILPDHC